MNFDRLRTLAGLPLNEDYDPEFRPVISYEEAAQILGVSESRVAQLASSDERLARGIYIDKFGGERMGVTYASVIQLLGGKRQKR